MTSPQTASSVIVCDHPLVHHNLTLLRDKNTPNETFRNAVRRVSQFILQSATQNLAVSKSYVETPICKAETRILSPEIPILITPILRAGLMMCDVAIDLMPSASVYHVGLYRDEETLKPITYYNKLPSNINYENAQLFLLDPMLATGGSAVAAVEIVSKLGLKQENITFVSILAAPEGIENLSKHYPQVKIYTGAVDERLNDKGYIVPGLGDAGDRTFGTV